MNLEFLGVSRETFFHALHQSGLVALIDGNTVRVRHNPRAQWEEAPADVAAILRERTAGDD
jgi:hypothetical protein